MRILILTKLREFIYSGDKTVHEYIKNDHAFDGFNEGFKANGHRTFLSWDESFFISQRFKIKFPLLTRLIKYAMRKSGINILDRYLFSKKIANYCINNQIDLIFTEINSFISPAVIRKFNPGIVVSQWYGVFPEMSDRDTLNIMSEYDFIWGPCEFHNDKVRFNGVEKFHYVGCAANDRLFYYEYDAKRKHDIVFIGGVGNAHADRIELLESVANRFDDFAFFGYGIENVPSVYKLREKYKGWVNPNEARKLISNAKVVINLTLNGYERIKRGFNSRLFEIASCNGGIQLCVYDQKIEEFFKIGEEIDVFKTCEELLERINFYLKNDEMRINMSNRAFSRSKNYTYKGVTSKICNIVASHNI